MAANGISTLPLKKDRQIAKLNLAQDKRQAVTPIGDNTSGWYRIGNVYDIEALPTQYGGDNLPGSIIDNANVGGLLDRHPWTGTAVLGLSIPTIVTQVNAALQPTITGTYDTGSATFAVTIDSITYTLAGSPELTAVGGDWTLDLDGTAQTLSPLTVYDVVAVSDGILFDVTTDEVTTANV